tara:strand:+ start:568 stop:1074 length:507 start_codon:yes stop_codon:yes gene_type:complete
MPNYKDTALNRRMGRVGKPHGSSAVTKAKLKARPAKNYRKGGAKELKPDSPKTARKFALGILGDDDKPKKKKVFIIKRSGSKKSQYDSSVKKLGKMAKDGPRSMGRRHIKVGGQTFGIDEANQITDPDYQKGRLLQTDAGQRVWSAMNAHKRKYFPKAGALDDVYGTH